jgi:hypothetical protein
MLSFLVSSQRNVQLHFLGSIRRPCLRAQHPLVFHGELSLPRGLKGGKASYNDQHGHISNTSVICWILGSPQRVNFFQYVKGRVYQSFQVSLSLWYTEPICLQKLSPEGIFSRQFNMTQLTQPTTDMPTFLQIDRSHGPVGCQTLLQRPLPVGFLWYGTR